MDLNDILNKGAASDDISKTPRPTNQKRAPPQAQLPPRYEYEYAQGQPSSYTHFRPNVIPPEAGGGPPVAVGSSTDPYNAPRQSYPVHLAPPTAAIGAHQQPMVYENFNPHLAHAPAARPLHPHQASREYQPKYPVHQQQQPHIHGRQDSTSSVASDEDYKVPRRPSVVTSLSNSTISSPPSDTSLKRKSPVPAPSNDNDNKSPSPSDNSSDDTETNKAPIKKLRYKKKRIKAPNSSWTEEEDLMLVSCSV